ncbi:hypothetical protein AB4865_09565 [Capnocytophaga sp. ARDL2]|uniref:hypothetical protein n=1 Tax=Capnocytophaga sp. ARDL2 TaxID=3238809 RepID=UPI003555C602
MLGSKRNKDNNIWKNVKKEIYDKENNEYILDTFDEYSDSLIQYKKNKIKETAKTYQLKNFNKN